MASASGARRFANNRELPRLATDTTLVSISVPKLRTRQEGVRPMSRIRSPAGDGIPFRPTGMSYLAIPPAPRAA